MLMAINMLALSLTAARADEPSTAAEVPLKKVVRVIDTFGKSVVGAIVVPWAIRSERGHGAWTVEGWGGSEPPKLTTDAAGEVTIPFPRFIDKERETKPKALTCRVEHPDFAETVYNDVAVVDAELPNEAVITLHPGARVSIAAYAGDEPLDVTHVHALWSSASHWSHGSPVSGQAGQHGWRELPRLPAGSELLRLLYVPDDGPVMFSGVRQLELADGERYKVRLEMRKACRINGHIDDSVPRPVQNGRVVAEVNARANGDGRNTLDWRESALIGPDGSFTLEAMPHGDLQVIALCDGFMAESGEPPEFAADHERQQVSAFNRPQVFPIADEQHEITLKMTPTADCLVRVLDPDRQPVQSATCSFWPNVGWWGGGSQIYCHPLYGTLAVLKNPDDIKTALKADKLYSAMTDAEGVALVKNLPPQQGSTFVVSDEKVQLKVAGDQGYGHADLTAGEPNNVTVTLLEKRK
jgi:hypothetical protein